MGGAVGNLEGFALPTGKSEFGWQKAYMSDFSIHLATASVAKSISNFTILLKKPRYLWLNLYQISLYFYTYGICG
jgi:hypothetical protein